jgi:hypothetical protein
VALAAVVIGIAPAHADTTAQNLAKYRRLRQRLVTEFTSVGTAPGQSEPVPERTDSAGLMKWGDETIALGFYLGVLATEHYILSNPATFPGADGGDPSQLAATDEELYDALYALERLDNVADAAFPDPCTTTPALNGFFVRDDVPADFASHFPGITTVESDFTDPTLTNKEESQDQVYHVQHGLALIVALVPASVVVHGKSLRAWAVEQATRITQHFAQGDWVIRNPACGNRADARGHVRDRRSVRADDGPAVGEHLGHAPSADEPGLQQREQPAHGARDHGGGRWLRIRYAAGDRDARRAAGLAAVSAAASRAPSQRDRVLLDGAGGQPARARDARRAPGRRRARMPRCERARAARLHDA